MDRPAPDGKTIAAFLGAMCIGGANYNAVSISNLELPPLFGAAMRFAAAALLFLLWLRWQRVPIARGRARAGAAAYGLLGIGVCYAFFYGDQALERLRDRVLIAAMPVVAVALGVVLLDQPVTVEILGGGTLVFAAVYVGAIAGKRGATSEDPTS